MKTEAIAIDKIRLGMLLFIGSESVFFTFLVIAYIYYHGSVVGGPTAHNSLDPLKTGMYTVVLLSSSATMWLAERAFRKQTGTFLPWLITTIGMGLIFLFGEIKEYAKMLHQDVTIDRNVFGSTYFTLTGFHAAHVTIGILLMTTLVLLSLSGKLMEKHGHAVESISYYWHFVDVVWVAVFSTVYLWSTR
jgi:cytochrome c oxidase subunit 3